MVGGRLRRGEGTTLCLFSPFAEPFYFPSCFVPLSFRIVEYHPCYREWEKLRNRFIASFEICETRRASASVTLYGHFRMPIFGFLHRHNAPCALVTGSGQRKPRFQQFSLVLSRYHVCCAMRTVLLLGAWYSTGAKRRARMAILSTEYAGIREVDARL